jgi:hypothetical protein
MTTPNRDAEGTSTHHDPLDQRRIAVYQVAANHYISGNELQWTLLYYYFVGCSILVVAWSTMFANSSQDANILVHTMVLSVLSLAGIVLSYIWLCLHRRANSYMPILFRAAKDAEDKVKVDSDGSITRVAEHRSSLADGVSTTRNFLTVIPLCFLTIFLVLFCVGLSLLPEANMDANAIETWAQIFSGTATTGAIVAAAWWFFVTARFRRRIQFDVDCSFFQVNPVSNWIIAELQFIFENKGFVEHKLYDLTVSVHAVESEVEPKVKSETKELFFNRRLLPRVSIVPRATGFFFIRPGVRQVITHIITIPASVSVIRVTSSFGYKKLDQYPHTARRIFKVSASLKSNT